MFKEFIKKEIVLCISFVLAVISAVFVHPDVEYISYIDFRTLSILLALMLVMAGLQKERVFKQIGEALVSKVSTVRSLGIVLVLLCFFFSMVITNDVALITFVPFTIIVMELAGCNDLLIPITVLETIAANLGSMVTPIGNPQNLYLFSLSNMSLASFFAIMAPYGLVALVGLIVAVFIMMNLDREINPATSIYDRTTSAKVRIVAYLIMFIVSLLVVARVLDYRVGLAIVVVAVLIFDFDVIKKADYSLLLTFICLFIFIGNMKRISFISDAIAGVVTDNELATAIVASQVISNVPAAILLSGFTSNIKELLIGVNFGGLGTLIASMASLISFKQYAFIQTSDKKKYIKVFTRLNILFLLILCVFYKLFSS